jgi:folylpolyglutamate synthase/dihydropteroate synthase
LIVFLQDSHFDYALFCPTRLRAGRSDHTNLNQDEVEQREKCEINRATWIDINRQVALSSSYEISIPIACVQTENANTRTETFTCIEEALNWLRDQSASNSMHVLVTGSLHLVGGVISILDPQLNMA